MKRSLRSLIRNTLVTVFLLGSAAGFGTLFLVELNSTVNASQNVVVGKIIALRGHAQRRYNKSVQWNSLSVQRPLYNLDALRTGEHSTAVISLVYIDDTGNEVFSEIQLGPETYVILELTEKTRNIAFVGGDISTNETQGLTVSTEYTIVDAGAGSVSLSHDEGQETSIRVTDGEASVTVNGQGTIVDTKSELRIGGNLEQATSVRTPMLPIAPKPNGLLLTYNDSRQVDFAWELFADWSNPVLEISQEPTFTDEATRRVPAENPVSLDVGMGQWYWRVKDEASEGNGLISIFTVDIEKKVTPSSPPQGMVIPYRGETASVNLQWHNAWYAEAYTVELADNPAFVDSQTFRNVENSSILIDQLNSGQWWWRVTPHHRRAKIDIEIQPTPRDFILKQQKRYEQIALLLPSDNESISMLDVRDGVSFRWKDQSGILSYRIDVSGNRDFNQILAFSEGSAHWANLLASPAPGTYYWRIEATATDNQPVPKSQIQRFEIKSLSNIIELIEPIIGETKHLEPYQTYNFTWRNEAEGNHRFTLYRLTGANRHRVIESITQEQRISTQLPGAGTYIWKVQYLDKNGNQIIESPEGLFKAVESLQSPELITPVPDETISMLGSGDLLLSWSPVAGADAYHAVLIAPDNTVIARNNGIANSTWELTLPDTMIPGRYRAKLTSIQNSPSGAGDRLSLAKTFQFFIDKIQLYSSAVPFLPENNAVFEAGVTYGNGIILNWNQNPPLSRWTIELSGNNLTQVYQSTSPQITLKNLSPGKYRWRVRSWDENETESPVSRVSNFTVNDFASPPQPIVTVPAQNSELDMTEARSLRFEWENSYGADYYGIVLHDTDSKIPILQEKPLTELSYVINNLKILSIGDFVLEVTAYTEYPDAGIIRTSETRHVPFSLSVQIPDNPPKILTDEFLYAN